jgi:hypothetical protein
MNVIILTISIFLNNPSKYPNPKTHTTLQYIITGILPNIKPLKYNLFK